MTDHAKTNKPVPPRWADRFLQWYCRPDLLEEIQGDVYELYQRAATQRKLKADVQFVWNVLRFFRLKNIRKRKSSATSISSGMIKNIFVVAIRNFFRQPGHSLLNVAGLAVSFFAALLILLWVSHEFSFDRFHENPERIFKVLSHVETNGSFETYHGAETQIDVSSIPEVESKTIVLDGTRWPNELCFRADSLTTDCIYLNGIYSEDNFFSTFRFPITEGDQQPLKKPNEIAISQNMSQRLYGTASPLGKVIKIDNYFPMTISSVFENVPSNSSLQFDFVMPLAFYKKMRGLSDEGFATYFLSVYLKTNTHITTDDLTQKLNHRSVLTERLKNDHVSYSAFALPEWRLHDHFENGQSTGGRIQYVRLFLVIAIMVVAMAIINFVNLSTARASSRSKEIGIRKVTGAFRSSIVLQFLGESFMVVLVALLLAAVLAQISIPYFNSVLGEQLSTSLISAEAVGVLLLFLLLVALAAGLYPAIVMSSFQPAAVLKSVTTRYSGAQQLRKVLLVVQVAVSLSIIVFSGILFQQLSFIQRQNLGYDRENILHIEPTYNLMKQYDAFKNELLQHPEIKSVTAGVGNPLNLHNHTTGVTWPGMPEGSRPTFQILPCNYELPETFGMTLLEGRSFTPSPGDTVNSEVLITEEAVKMMQLKEPIGTIFKVGAVNCKIIGVLRDFHTESLRNEKLPVILYQHPTLNCSAIYVRYQPGTTQAAMAVVQETYKKMEPSFTMKYTFLDDVFNKMYKTEQTASYMVIFFTAISFVIAIIGVVGLSTYNVMRRKKEIGIKRVFGASVANILSMLSREFLILISLSTLLAIPFAWYSADQWLSGFAYRIDMPWWMFGVTFTIVTTITLALICVQALRTVTTNPTKVLRNE